MFPHLWYAPEEMAGRLDELRREAEADRMARRLAATRGAAGPHRRILSGMGGALVKLGYRLEKLNPQPCAPIQGETGCSG
jgi:hypothetical protein